MDTRTVRLYRDRWRMVADIEAAEQRAATLDERWRQTNRLLAMALALELDLTQHRDEEEVRRRWLKLQDQA